MESKCSEVRVNTSRPEFLATFVEQQEDAWPIYRQARRALQVVERRKIVVGNDLIVVQFNPGRKVNITASTSGGQAGHDGCFLCQESLPPEQSHLVVGDNLVLLCNPRPICDLHFTIASTVHEPQSLQGHVEGFVEVAHKVGPELLVFFNGARSGASAPTHYHLQAIPASILPLVVSLRLNAEVRANAAKDGVCSFCGLTYGFHVENSSEDAVGALVNVLEQRQGDDELLNCVVWWTGESYILITIPRRAHRPVCFFEQGDRQLLISPGTLEMCGLVITARRSDFNNLTSVMFLNIMAQVGI